MTKFSTTLHLPPDQPEEEIDQIGRAVLVEQARLKKRTITGPVERIYDEFVVGVSVVIDGQATIKHVPVGSTLAGARTDPDARMVTWQADAEPITADPAPVVVALPPDGVTPARTAVAPLPAAITAAGGMVSFRHNLGSDDVTITVYDAQGSEMLPEFAIGISQNEQQVQLLAGSAQIHATIDPEENA